MSIYSDEEDLFGVPEVDEPGSGGVEDLENSEQQNRDDEAVEVPEPGKNAATVIKPKRVIQNPQPKLDVARLCGPKGIGIVQKWLSDAPYKGKGHETEDLGLLLKKLEHWAHRLYPKLPFVDTITQIEKLGNKKAVQVNVKKLRLDMYDTPTTNADDAEKDIINADDDNTADQQQPDIFDELLQQTASAGTLRDRVGGGDAPPITSSTSSNIVPPAPGPAIVLTDEQRARIELNKRLAMERRRAALEAAAASATTLSSSDKSDRIGGTKRQIDDEEEEELIAPSSEQLRDLRGSFLNRLSQQSQRLSNNDEKLKSVASVVAEFEEEEIDEAMNIDEVVSNLNAGTSNNTDGLSESALPEESSTTNNEHSVANDARSFADVSENNDTPEESSTTNNEHSVAIDVRSSANIGDNVDSPMSNNSSIGENAEDPPVAVVEIETSQEAIVVPAIEQPKKIEEVNNTVPLNKIQFEDNPDR